MEEETLKFYIQDRWVNWMKTFQSQEFDSFKLGKESDLKDFDNLERDIILAYLGLIERFEKKRLGKKKSLKAFSDMLDVILEIPPIENEDVKTLIRMVQFSLFTSGRSCITYIKNDFDAEAKPNHYVKEAKKHLKTEDLDDAFESVTRAGALILAGKKLNVKSENEEYLSDWLDSLDSLQSVIEMDRS